MLSRTSSALLNWASCGARPPSACSPVAEPAPAAAALLLALPRAALVPELEPGAAASHGDGRGLGPALPPALATMEHAAVAGVDAALLGWSEGERGMYAKLCRTMMPFCRTRWRAPFSVSSALRSSGARRPKALMWLSMLSRGSGPCSRAAARMARPEEVLASPAGGGVAAVCFTSCRHRCRKQRAGQTEQMQQRSASSQLLETSTTVPAL